MKKRALFLDRDGVINKEICHLYKIEDFVFIDGIFEICHFYIKQGFIIIIITNQAGIAKGLYTEKDFSTLTTWMISEFAKRKIDIKKVYYCPHHPDYTGKCNCRKPNPGMIFHAEKDFNLDLKKSLLIGDNLSDIEAGLNAGIEHVYYINDLLIRLNELPLV